MASTGCINHTCKSTENLIRKKRRDTGRKKPVFSAKAITYNQQMQAAKKSLAQFLAVRRKEFIATEHGDDRRQTTERYHNKWKTNYWWKIKPARCCSSHAQLTAHASRTYQEGAVLAARHKGQSLDQQNAATAANFPFMLKPHPETSLTYCKSL